MIPLISESFNLPQKSPAEPRKTPQGLRVLIISAHVNSVAFLGNKPRLAADRHLLKR